MNFVSPGLLNPMMLPAKPVMMMGKRRVIARTIMSKKQPRKVQKKRIPASFSDYNKSDRDVIREVLYDIAVSVSVIIDTNAHVKWRDDLCEIGETWAPDEYDRTRITVSPLNETWSWNWIW